MDGIAWIAAQSAKIGLDSAHSGVLPGMQDLAKYMALPIMTEVWEELVAK